jgi:hypothetical protein
MPKTDNANRDRKQEPGRKFSQPSDELVKENTKHVQEVADSRDHDKQSGKRGDPKKPVVPPK